jgi:dTDP-4-amino-4,6-dideoxygalactose transaminase
MGTLGTFSFFPTKNLGTLGEGGLVTTADPDLAEKVRKLRVHGAKQKYFHELIGGNFRLHELQAAFLRVKLRHLDQALKNRLENTQKLIPRLQEKWKADFSLDQCVCEGESRESVQNPAGAVLLPFSCQQSPAGHTWNQFVIRVVGAGRRDEWRNKLALDGFQTEVYYPRSMHEQACFSVQDTPGEYPMAERLAAESLALPLRFDPPGLP